MRSMKSKCITLASILLMSVSTQINAAKIIPHFTEGPGVIFGFLPTQSMSGPKPILPGSDIGAGMDTGTDCSAISLADKLSTQTGAVCNAVEQWERIIKDDIVIHYEIYAIGLLDNVLGFSAPRTVTLSSPKLDGAGYNAMKHLLQTDENKERDALNAPNHLPKFKQLKVLLPDRDDIPQDWKPQTIEIASAAAKALGLNPDEMSSIYNPEQEGLTTLPNVDAVFVSSALIDNPDFDQTNGIGVGPVPLGQWDALDVPNNILSFEVFPEIFDYTGIVTHELGHSLGYFSTADDINAGDTFARPPALQGINATDLFRFAETDIIKHKNWGKYGKLPRQLAVRQDGPIDESGALPIEPELGNHVTVFHLHPKKGLFYIPMAGGDDLEPGMGDGTQASHSRSSFIRVRDANGDLQSQTWIENRCPEATPGCDPVAGDETHTPIPRLMDPIAVIHTRITITAADAIILDLIGYDIDYAELPGTPRSGIIGTLQNPSPQSKISTKQLEKEFGVEFGITNRLIIDHR